MGNEAGNLALSMSAAVPDGWYVKCTYKTAITYNTRSFGDRRLCKADVTVIYHYHQGAILDVAKLEDWLAIWKDAPVSTVETLATEIAWAVLGVTAGYLVKVIVTAQKTPGREPLTVEVMKGKLT